MKKLLAIILILGISTTSVVGCGKQEIAQKPINKSEVKTFDFSYQLDPATLELALQVDGEKLVASAPGEEKKATNVQQGQEKTTVEYREEDILVDMEKKDDYLAVNIESTIKEDNEFTWPLVDGERYLLPFGEGKQIPKDDAAWMKFLDDEKLKAIEQLSMGFFAVEQGEHTLVYIIEGMFNDTLNFNTENGIRFDFTHQFTSINEDKDYGFRIYVTENNPVSVAKIYRNYIIEQGKFTTLEEKAKNNPNIEKLYGAVHVYLWDKSVLSEGDIKWQQFRQELSSPVIDWIKELAENKLEAGTELVKVLDDVGKQDYVDNYQKGLIIQGLSEVLLMPEFYQKDVFTKTNKEIDGLLDKGIDQLTEVELIELNKQLLAVNMPNAFGPVEQWANDRTIDIIKDMKEAGIGRAWFGLDHWVQGFIKPEMVQYANDNGYLMGPYDSYHSIHKPGEEQWHTATFEDQTLYEEATVMNKEGELEVGFQGVGRKLNPTLSMPSVEERVKKIMDTGVKFNSWFVDCDATGEIYDDYSKEHITTEEQDLEARLKRMAYIGDEYNMVVGSEGGNDFASQTIAFAHGIELPTFAWRDKDMGKNKESEYYLGAWYNAKGGVPHKFGKQVPVKEELKEIFLNPEYNIPLFKLVYNDSFITSYHWDWSTFKIADEVENRMLYELLYNVPPMYHLDQEQWEKYKELIVNHSNTWSELNKKVINQEMTDFNVLSEDKMVQMSQFGEDVRVVVNYGNQSFVYEDTTIEPKTGLIITDEGKEIYKPQGK